MNELINYYLVDIETQCTITLGYKTTRSWYDCLFALTEYVNDVVENKFNISLKDASEYVSKEAEYSISTVNRNFKFYIEQGILFKTKNKDKYLFNFLFGYRGEEDELLAVADKYKLYNKTKPFLRKAKAESKRRQKLWEEKQKRKQQKK